MPQLYIKKLEESFLNSIEPYNSLFCPPIFFSRNDLQVPSAVRANDIAWSIMVTQNLSNTNGLSFPCSVYSLSMILAESIGYWDVDFNAIGEDIHMAIKCFYKRNTRVIPIHVPINMTNVQTGGMFSTLTARFVQAKRHALAVADTSFALRHTFSMNLVSTERILMCYRVLEAFILPAISGWVLILGNIMFHCLPESDTAIYQYVNILFKIVPIPMLLSCLLYEFFHRFVEDRLYPGKNHRDLRHLVDWVVLPISCFFYVTVAHSIGGIQRLVPGNGLVYVTSEKEMIEI